MSADARPGILFLEALPTIAGGQTVLLNLVPALIEEFRLAALLPGEGPLAAALRQAGVTCFFAPIGRYSLLRKSPRDVVAYSARTPLLAWRTAQLIRRWDAALVYANSGPTFLWGALAAQLTARPLIWHHHSLLADSKTLALVRAAARLPAVRTIICASTAAQAQLAAPHPKSVTIPNGVDIARFRPDPAARVQLRRTLGIAAATPVVGMVGDLLPLKRQDTLLAARPLLLPEFPDLCIIFVGDARPDDAESKLYADQLTRAGCAQVLFLGRRADLPDLLNIFDVLVVASERETGPLVLLEALATGVPVISTPVGRAPELLTQPMLFPIGDASALAQRLQRLLAAADVRAQAGVDARSLAEQRLSLAEFRTALHAVVQRVLAAQPG